jgi:hypothetical protein
MGLYVTHRILYTPNSSIRIITNIRIQVQVPQLKLVNDALCLNGVLLIHMMIMKIGK